MVHLMQYLHPHTRHADSATTSREETGYIGEVVKDRAFDVSPVMYNGEYHPTAFLVSDTVNLFLSHRPYVS